MESVIVSHIRDLHNHSVQLLIIILFGSFLIYKLRLSMVPDSSEEQSQQRFRGL